MAFRIGEILVVFNLFQIYSLVLLARVPIFLYFELFLKIASAMSTGMGLPA